jgi:hypothetical protein
VELFKNYLTKRPKELLASIKAVVPKYMDKQLGIDEWKWVNKLISDEKGLFTLMRSNMKNDFRWQLKDSLIPIYIALD